MKTRKAAPISTPFIRYAIVLVAIVLGTCLLPGICSVFDQGRWTTEVQAQEVGGLRVTITPQEAIDAGAQWRVDGGTWRDSGVSVGIQAGDHTVEFKDIARWDAPGDIPVTVVADEITEATGTYTVNQSLRVFITPEGAIDAGAQWNVDGGPWQDSGTTVPDLSVGDHTVNYKEVFGWSAPPSETVTIVAGEITETTGTYTQLFGSLKATITAQAVISEGAQWKVDDGYWQDSGTTISDITAGDHTVVYKSVFGWTRPVDQTVTVYDSQTTNTTGNYTQITTGVTLRVPSDYTTIQAAINAASDGDTVLVADGTYVGLWNKDLDFNGKAIKVASENGPENCIIDCEGSGRALYFHGAEDTDSVVGGFTLTRCHPSSIYCYNSSSPNISTCIITGNSSYFGGGIECHSSSPILSNCLIYNNTALTRSPYPSHSGVKILPSAYPKPGLGGGICCHYSSSPTIVNCTICKNTAQGGLEQIGQGGALYCDSSSLPAITNSIFWDNSPNEIVGDADTIYSDVKGGYPGLGNIDADPLFGDSDKGDYRLWVGSPCIDTGTSEGAPATDIDGVPRPQGAGFDMGAYEFTEEAIVYISHDGICDDNTPCYAFIQEGIDWDGLMFTLKAEQGVFGEHIVLDELKKVFFQGGWDSEFSSPSGVTEVYSVTISNGTMVLDEGCLAIGVD